MAMTCLSGLTVWVYGLLGTALASSALGMARGIITLLNLCIPQEALEEAIEWRMQSGGIAWFE